MAPGGKNGDLLGLLGNTVSATYCLSKADTMKFSGSVFNPHGLSQHLTSTPLSGSHGDGGSGNFLPQGLGSARENGLGGGLQSVNRGRWVSWLCEELQEDNSMV